jgi:hypothetical protein
MFRFSAQQPGTGSKRQPPGGAGLLVLLAACTAAPAQITTSQYDNSRSGAYLKETRLTPANVNTRQFGKLFSLAVDGDLYAQPLYVPQLEIPGKGRHNTVFIATEHDSVYAYDADGPGPPLWQVNVTDAARNISTVAARSVQCPFIRPEIGITGTPVIDPDSRTIYFVARTYEGTTLSHKFVQRLHALDIATGAERPGSPAEIGATWRRSGTFTSNVEFDPLRENQRAGLLLVNGNVYVTWASSCDVGPYYGWVISYDAKTLRQTGTANLSPDGEESGIWQGDAAPAADADGNIYVVTGNGKFTAAGGGHDYGDSVVKLKLASGGMSVVDYFTPSEQQQMNATDLDLGSQGPVLLPDQPGNHRHELVIAGKGDGFFVVDRDNMGKYQPGNDAHAVQKIAGVGGGFGAAAVWNGHVFVYFSDDVLRSYSLQDGRLSGPEKGTVKFIDPGATPTISADGNKNGIVWVIESKGWRSEDRPAVLHAFDAANVSHHLYSSSEAGGRDTAGACLRFSIPTVMNGRVYVGAKKEVDVYGLLPQAAKR